MFDSTVKKNGQGKKRNNSCGKRTVCSNLQKSKGFWVAESENRTKQKKRTEKKKKSKNNIAKHRVNHSCSGASKKKPKEKKHRERAQTRQAGQAQKKKHGKMVEKRG